MPSEKTHLPLTQINQELAHVRLEIEKAKLAKLRREITEFEQEGNGYNAMASPTPDQRAELLSRIDDIYQTLRQSADKQRAQSQAEARDKIWARDRAKAP